jgi:hypothetical protein
MDIVTIELTRKHAVCFTLLVAVQTLGFWISFNRSHSLCSPSIWIILVSGIPGSAFLTTVVLIELVRGVFS